MLDGAALAGRRIPDDHVPGQLVQRLGAARQPQLGGLDGVDRLQHALAQHLGIVALRGIGLGDDGLAQAGAGALAQPAARQPPDTPGGQQQQAGEHGPDGRHFKRFRAEQKDCRERGNADHGQYAAVGEKLPESGHSGFGSES
jgi:hypothetical protein